MHSFLSMLSAWIDTSVDALYQDTPEFSERHSSGTFDDLHVSRFLPSRHHVQPCVYWLRPSNARARSEKFSFFITIKLKFLINFQQKHTGVFRKWRQTGRFAQERQTNGALRATMVKLLWGALRKNGQTNVGASRKIDGKMTH